MRCPGRVTAVRPVAAALALAMLLSACGQGAGSQVPGDSSDTRPFADIAGDEVLRLTGTEPFWGGEISGSTLTYSTPENIAGTEIAVERFAGRGGLSFSGELEGGRLDMMVTPGECSDGMSDRTYPFTVSLRLGEEERQGCAWSARHPFTGEEAP